MNNHESEKQVFRARGKKFLLTYNSMDPLVPEEMKVFHDWFNSISPVKSLVIANDIAPTTGMKHVHVAIEFTNPIDLTHNRFKYKNVLPDIKPKKTQAEWDNAVKYCSEKETNYKINIKEISNTTVATIVNKVNDCKTPHEAVKLCANKINEVVPILNLFKTKTIQIEQDVLDEYKDWTPLPWQQEILDLINTEPDKRKIYWYWENTGNIGKSEFTRYISCTKQDTVMPIFNVAKAADIFHIFTKKFTNGVRPTAIVIDLPRKCENTESLYTILEGFKNGMVTSPKFDGDNIIFKRPHVIVFANFKPKKKFLSQDRWIVKELENPNKKTESEDSE